MKISLQRFLILCFLFVFFCAGLTAVTFWYSTHYNSEAIKNLTDSVESAASVQLIEQNLAVHRRQALLKGLYSKTIRRARSDEAKKDLLAASANLSNYSSSGQEEDVINHVQANIESYIKDYEASRAKGFQAVSLYESVSEEYYQAQVAINALMKFNLNETQKIEAETVYQNRINYSLVTVAFILLSISFIFLMIGIRKYFYHPIVKLKNVIEDFELGHVIENDKFEGSIEIQSIASSFRNLATKLIKQKDAQLTFLSAIAHDLKNPLTAIKMSTELIADDSAISDQSRQMISIVGRQSDHLLRLINDLLDTTRAEAGHLDLNFKPTDIREIVQDCVKLHTSLSYIHQIELELPPEPIQIKCDGQRLAQVFNNLLNNAIKYSPNGGRIKVKANLSGEFALIEFSDSGVGIISDDVERIFEPFHRSSTTRYLIPGIGLGLSISRKIIRAHESGDILVTSRHGLGTKFTVKMRAIKKDEILLKQDFN